MPANESVETSPANAEVKSKYEAAADIANGALTFAIAGAVANANILELCQRTDDEIRNLAAQVYDKTKLAKGVAFPTSISVNNILCHFSPAASDNEASHTLKDGDLIKIELGAHIDGFPALLCHSSVVGATKEKPATGVAAELIQAAHQAAEAALRLVRPGANNYDVCPPLIEIANEYNFKHVEGMMSHLVTKDVIDGENAIILNPTDVQKKSHRRGQFNENDVFVVDIALSAGDGKIRQHECRTSIFKRTDSTYMLKLKVSRTIFSEVQTKFGTMAFNRRSLDDETRTRIGLAECQKSGLIIPYDVLADKDDSITARFMYTAILMADKSVKLTDYQHKPELISSGKNLKSASLLELLAKPADGSSKQ